METAPNQFRMSFFFSLFLKSIPIHQSADFVGRFRRREEEEGSSSARNNTSFLDALVDKPSKHGGPGFESDYRPLPRLCRRQLLRPERRRGGGGPSPRPGGGQVPPVAGGGGGRMNASTCAVACVEAQGRPGQERRAELGLAVLRPQGTRAFATTRNRTSTR
jgi:hypothetical protein